MSRATKKKLSQKRHKRFKPNESVTEIKTQTLKSTGQTNQTAKRKCFIRKNPPKILALIHMKTHQICDVNKMECCLASPCINNTQISTKRHGTHWTCEVEKWILRKIRKIDKWNRTKNVWNFESAEREIKSERERKNEHACRIFRWLLNWLHVSLCLMECASIFFSHNFYRSTKRASNAGLRVRFDEPSNTSLTFSTYIIYTVEPILGIQNIHTSNSIEYFGKTRSHTLAHTAHVLSAHASIWRKKRIKEIHFRRIVIDVLFVSFIPSPFQSYTPFTHQVLFTLAWWRLSHYLYAWKLTNSSECRISAAMLLAVT